MIACIIADFFETYGLHYTHSIFLPEMKINPEEIISKDNILQHFNI